MAAGFGRNQLNDVDVNLSLRDIPEWLLTDMV
jgi:hypothetical protein